MGNIALHFGFYFILINSALSSTILSSARGEESYYSTIVIFNITDPKTGHFEKLGSADPHDDIGKYGSASPKKNVTGVIALPLNQSGHIYGCTEAYNDVKLKVPWVALVERGECTFAKKIEKAFNANASGIIVFDTKNDVIVMSHEGADQIVSVTISRDVGREVARRVNNGQKVTVNVIPGQRYDNGYPLRNKTSIIFVSLSFLILMIISLTWLIVYYVQRFRLVQTPDILKQRRNQARKIINELPKKILKEGDKELLNDDICPICIESYKVCDILRILPCDHILHRKCVDPWLRMKETCPMCKLDVLKCRGLKPSSHDSHPIFGPTSSAPVVEVWEPERDEATIVSTSTDSLVHGSHESTALVVVESSRSIESENNNNRLDSNAHNTHDPDIPGPSTQA
uniref:RING finger protein 150-like n=1 Tax=Styela clava TaxID=7725 RepID=UPI00193AD9FE|nr:RING finger protein 150-like [Styela clava]